MKGVCTKLPQRLLVCLVLLMEKIVFALHVVTSLTLGDALAVDVMDAGSVIGSGCSLTISGNKTALLFSSLLLPVLFFFTWNSLIAVSDTEEALNKWSFIYPFIHPLVPSFSFYWCFWTFIFYDFRHTWFLSLNITFCFIFSPEQSSPPPLFPSSLPLP